MKPTTALYILEFFVSAILVLTINGLVITEGWGVALIALGTFVLGMMASTIVVVYREARR